MRITFCLLSFLLFSQFLCSKTEPDNIQNTPIRSSNDLVGSWEDTKTYNFAIVANGITTPVTYSDNTFNFHSNGTFDVTNYELTIDYMKSGTWAYDSVTAVLTLTEATPTDPVELVIFNSLTMTYTWDQLSLTSDGILEATTYYNQVFNDGSLPSFNHNSVRTFRKL
jgi:hypothetical protein